MSMVLRTGLKLRICILLVSEWLLFNAKWTIFQLYQSWREQVWCSLCTRSTHFWDFYRAIAHYNNIRGYACYSTLYVTPLCMLFHSACYSTLYVIPLCMLLHSVCYSTLHVTPLCMLLHSVCYSLQPWYFGLFLIFISAFLVEKQQICNFI